MEEHVEPGSDPDTLGGQGEKTIADSGKDKHQSWRDTGEVQSRTERIHVITNII